MDEELPQTADVGRDDQHPMDNTFSEEADLDADACLADAQSDVREVEPLTPLWPTADRRDVAMRGAARFGLKPPPSHISPSDLDWEYEREHAELMYGRIDDLIVAKALTGFEDICCARDTIEEYMYMLDDVADLKQRIENVEDAISWGYETGEHRHSYSEVEALQEKLAEREDYLREWDWSDYEQDLERVERRHRAKQARAQMRAHAAKMRARVRPVCAAPRVNRHARGSRRIVRVAAKKTTAKAAADPDGPPSRRALPARGGAR